MLPLFQAVTIILPIPLANPLPLLLDIIQLKLLQVNHQHDAQSEKRKREALQTSRWVSGQAVKSSLACGRQLQGIPAARSTHFTDRSEFRRVAFDSHLTSLKAEEGRWFS